MIFFGHLGITTGIIKGYEKIFFENKSLDKQNAIDYRYVLVGAVLPDIIDKPIGAYLFRSTFHNSRIFAHTLLFSILLLAIGIYILIKSGNNNVLSLGASSGIHLILDSMWSYPAILFWPYFGIKFPKRPEGNWVGSDMDRLFSDPTYYVPEIVGLIIILFYLIKLLRNKQMKDFVRKGKL